MHNVKYEENGSDQSASSAKNSLVISFKKFCVVFILKAVSTYLCSGLSGFQHEILVLLSTLCREHTGCGLGFSTECNEPASVYGFNQSAEGFRLTILSSVLSTVRQRCKHLGNAHCCLRPTSTALSCSFTRTGSHFITES